MAVPVQHFSYHAEQLSQALALLSCICDIYIRGLAFQNELSQTETHDLLLILIKVLRRSWGLQETYQQPSIRKPTDLLSVPISG